jgi:hypothetical protein
LVVDQVSESQENRIHPVKTAGVPGQKLPAGFDTGG